MLLRASALLVALAVALPASASARGLETGIQDPLERAFNEADPEGAYEAVRGAGITVVRVPIYWYSVAPGPPRTATDPDDPGYDWSTVDARLEPIVRAGLTPMVVPYAAPRWAKPAPADGAPRPLTPHAGDYGAFMTAFARRYDGSVPGRPAVRYWQLWNEPNLKTYLDEAGAPERYREMVNAAAPAVRAAHPDNVVIAGSLGPFAGPNGRYGSPPLQFMRRFLSEPVAFDAWAHHPYTSGPPARSARAPGDASLGDLPEMRRILRRAERAGRVAGTRRARFVVTEFSWDTAPPDPFAVPLREHARWVSEGLYRMWRVGIDLVVWFQLRDNPKGTFEWGQTFQSGLYMKTTERYRDEKAKPALRALRFPFVALPSGRRVVLWGRTPDSAAGRVRVERRGGGRWRTVRVLRADRDGIFRGALPRRGSAAYRAVVDGERSLPFVARRTRDRFVNPFGGTSLP